MLTHRVLCRVESVAGDLVTITRVCCEDEPLTVDRAALTAAIGEPVHGTYFIATIQPTRADIIGGFEVTRFEPAPAPLDVEGEE